MAYWLVKDEPESWSYQKHAAEGVASWDGVRNFQAANNLRAMKKGDRAFFYHSVTEKRLAGVLEVVREAYPDPRYPKGRLVVVDLEPRGRLARPVALAQIKAMPEFADSPLVRQGRLSVVPIGAEQWRRLEERGRG